MIAKLKGLLDSVGKDTAVLDVGGVGYLVYCSSRTLGSLPEPGRPVSLHIETHVREDHIHLYGFPATAERDWFRQLLTVQGVGARVALAILGTLSPDALFQAIAAQDKAILTRAEGVGPKLAGRIVSELRDRVGAMAITIGADAVIAEIAADGLDTVAAEAISALVNLGYGRTEAFGAVNHASRAFGGSPSLEALIPAALKELGR